MTSSSNPSIISTIKIAACSAGNRFYRLVDRLKLYRPKAIVILLCSIKPMVLEAMREAGISYEPYTTPYPGFGNQPRFRKAMAEIIPNSACRSRHAMEGILPFEQRTRSRQRRTP